MAPTEPGTLRGAAAVLAVASRGLPRGAREDVERLSVDLRRAARRGFAPDAFRIAVYQALRLARVAAAYHQRISAPDADAA